MKKVLQKIIPKIIGAKINITAFFNPKIAGRQAFILFCTPRRGKIKPDQATYLDPVKLEVLENERTKIQTYHWPGSGEKVLLVHGWESNTHRWHLLIDELRKKNYDIYAIDAPAHGYSSGNILNVPLYAAAIETAVQAYNPDTIISHSVGGLATIFHTFKYNPTTLNKLVLLGTASELAIIMKDYKKILGLSKRTMTALEGLIKERFGFNFKGFSGIAFAKAIKVPTLIIHDTFDKITGVEGSRSIHKNIPGSTYIETEGLGHSLYQEGVRKEILRFIE